MGLLTLTNFAGDSSGSWVIGTAHFMICIQCLLSREPHSVLFLSIFFLFLFINFSDKTHFEAMEEDGKKVVKGAKQYFICYSSRCFPSTCLVLQTSLGLPSSLSFFSQREITSCTTSSVVASKTYRHQRVHHESWENERTWLHVTKKHEKK